MADEAVLGFGAKFFLHDGSTLVEWDGIVGVSPPQPAVETVDSTHHGSSGGVRTHIPGLLDYGEISVRLFWSPGSTTDTKMLASIAARTARAFKIVVVETDGTTQDVTGSCIPTGVNYDEVVVDDKMTYQFTAKVTGAVTQAASA
jgi:hypothetical protein